MESPCASKRPPPELTDEELVLAAREAEGRWAVDRLVVRYYCWINRLIRLWAEGTSLKLEDIEDAVQDAFFALEPAIAQFDPSRGGGESASRFRNFFRKLVLDRFHNFLKTCWGAQRRRERALGDRDVAEGPDCQALAILDWLPSTVCGASNPVQATIRKESLARLEQCLEELSAPEQNLWQQLASGNCRCVIARELGITLEVLKQRRQRLLAKIRARLQDDYG